MAPSPDETEARAQMPSVLSTADATKLAEAPVEVKSTHKNWSIKDGQEVVDKHTGLHLRFGSYGDNSNTVFLIATLAGPDAPGITIVFQREGEPTRLLPHVVGKGAAEALDENVEREDGGANDDAFLPASKPLAFTPIS